MKKEYGAITAKLRGLVPGEHTSFTAKEIGECLSIKVLVSRLNQEADKRGIKFRTQLIRSYTMIKVYAYANS